MRIKSMMKGMLAVVMAMSMAASDYVQKGIEVLDNDTGFFMMCEGGKIDWACHANDAGAKDKTEDLHKMIKEYKFDEQE